MPKGAEFIIRSLENAGFEAYIVGGCVRDGILGRDPEDVGYHDHCQAG